MLKDRNCDINDYDRSAGEHGRVKGYFLYTFMRIDRNYGINDYDRILLCRVNHSRITLQRTLSRKATPL